MAGTARLQGALDVQTLKAPAREAQATAAAPSPATRVRTGTIPLRLTVTVLDSDGSPIQNVPINTSFDPVAKNTDADGQVIYRGVKESNPTVRLQPDGDPTPVLPKLFQIPMSIDLDLEKAIPILESSFSETWDSPTQTSIYTEDFTGCPGGTLPSGWSIVGPTYAQRCNETRYHNAPSSIEVGGFPANQSWGVASPPFDPSAFGFYEVVFWFIITDFSTTNSTDIRMQWYLSTDNTALGTGNRCGIRVQRKTADLGDLHYLTPTTWVDTGVDINRNQWYKVTIQVDEGSRTYTVLLNDVVVASDVAMTIGTNKYWKQGISTGISGGGGRIFADEITITGFSYPDWSETFTLAASASDSSKKQEGTRSYRVRTTAGAGQNGVAELQRSGFSAKYVRFEGWVNFSIFSGSPSLSNDHVRLTHASYGSLTLTGDQIQSAYDQWRKVRFTFWYDEVNDLRKGRKEISTDGSTFTQVGTDTEFASGDADADNPIYRLQIQGGSSQVHIDTLDVLKA